MSNRFERFQLLDDDGEFRIVDNNYNPPRAVAEIQPDRSSTLADYIERAREMVDLLNDGCTYRRRLDT